MQNLKSENEGRQQVHVLVEEVLRGEHKKDILLNSSYEFDQEVQAIYFSNARKNMSSDIAYVVMNDNQQLEDIKILKGLNQHE